MRAGIDALDEQPVALLARRRECAFPDLPDVAEATWRAMVAAFVAREQALLAATEPVEPHATDGRPEPDHDGDPSR